MKHYIQPKMRFTIVGIASKEDGYPYDGILVKFRKLPINLRNMLIFEPIDLFAKFSVPPSVWEYFQKVE